MKKTLIYTLFLASLVVAGCKDGDPGPTGQKGATGATGNKGATGDTGQGFDNAVKDGNILVTLSGKRPTDNADFLATQDFKYTVDGNGPAYVSNVYKDTNTGILHFTVERFLGAVDYHVNDNYVYLEFEVSTAGVVTLDYFEIETSVVDGKKYFDLYQYDENSGIVSLTNYNYDSSKGQLKFNFAGTFTAGSTSTGNDLTISGVASVNVYEALNNIVPGD